MASRSEMLYLLLAVIRAQRKKKNQNFKNRRSRAPLRCAARYAYAWLRKEMRCGKVKSGAVTTRACAPAGSGGMHLRRCPAYLSAKKARSWQSTQIWDSVFRMKIAAICALARPAVRGKFLKLRVESLKTSQRKASRIEDASFWRSESPMLGVLNTTSRRV